MKILSLNGGSSSVKFALFESESGTRTRILRGKIDHIGLSSASFTSRMGSEEAVTRTVAVPDAVHAISLLIEWLKEQNALSGIAAVAHRIVHGAHFTDHVVVTHEVLDSLRKMIPYDPDHMPAEIALIEACRDFLPDVFQIACFDTVFHRTLPPVATLLPIPRTYQERGIRKYGFHGLSYESIVRSLRKTHGDDVIAGNVVVAHLGNGASLAALKDGVSMDTSMAFSPNSGVPMGTRSGDIDAGVIRYMALEEWLMPDEIDEVLNTQSGLLGMSGTTYDMYELLSKEKVDTAAHEAIEVFCYAVRKQIGAYAAALGGIRCARVLGGMGEASAPIRARITGGLSFLGIEIDSARNETNAESISTGRTKVFVQPTDEESLMSEIAERIIRS